MPVGIQIDGVEFSEVALKTRPEHAAVLGRIFTSWSLIEVTVSSLLGLMMHAEPRAAVALLSQFNANWQRVKAVRKVAKEMLPDEDKAGFDALMKDVLSHAEKRNEVAHGLWGAHPDRPELVYRMAMSAFSEFAVTAPHEATVDAEAVVHSFNSRMQAFTIEELVSIEEEGAGILRRVMLEATGRAEKITSARPGDTETGQRPT